MTEEYTQQHVLIVDDTPANIAILGETLSALYEIRVATNGQDALDICRSETPPDLILLDIMMPEMDGLEVCKRLKESELTRHIPVIFVTAKDEESDEEMGFSLGAVDYITKPISVPIVRARVATQLALSDQNRTLEQKVQERSRELNDTQDATIRAMTILAEYRDNETGGHIVRTQHYVRILAEELRDNLRFCDVIGSLEAIELLFKSAALHDVGKVAIRDDILLKPGVLTNEEFDEMKRHTVYGYEALAKAEKSLSYCKGSSFLSLAKEIAYSHHEKYDGSGYPLGTKGDDIPISGRLMSLADIYDALVSKRVYKSPFSHKKAFSIITEGDGRVEPAHLDPDVIAAFVKSHDKFIKIAMEFADSEEERQALLGDD